MKISKKILSFVFALVLLMTSVSFPASAKSASDFQDTIDYWDKFIEENEKGEADDLKILDALDKQNDAINEQIVAKQADIAPLQKKIDELEKRVVTLEKRLELLEKKLK